MNRYTSMAALLVGGLLSSACGKKTFQDITEAPPSNSRMKFFNFGVNAPSVNFYANNTKMTAVTSSTGVEATTGVSYGQVGAGGAYTAIPAGPTTLTGRIAATTDKDLPVATVSTTIDDGKWYSMYVSGIYNTTTKTVDAFVVEDPVVPPTDFTVATVRFVNAISNANPMALYATDTTTKVERPVGTVVAYKTAGTFVQIPGGVYDLSSRYAGATTNAIRRTAITFGGGRVYTVTARGDITVTPTTTGCATTNKTCLDITANR